MTQSVKISLFKFCCEMGFPFQDSPKNLDPSLRWIRVWGIVFEGKNFHFITKKKIIIKMVFLIVFIASASLVLIAHVSLVLISAASL